MYRTKKDVDAYVRNALTKIKSEQERQLRSLTIAKLYFKIYEYESAEQYATLYLRLKEDNDQAHKLLGQCYQRQKKYDKALQSFQRSLQLNPKQADILAEVCQLLLEDDNLNINKAKYWCDLAETEKIQNDAVFSLRLKLMNKDNNENNQVEELIQKEISSRPNDVQLRVRLIRLYIDQQKILEAFNYVYNLEMTKNNAFINSMEWYNIVWLVLNKYELLPTAKKDWEFWLCTIICLERQVHLSFLWNGASVTEITNFLFQFDQYLFKISNLSDKFCVRQELLNLFLNHYRGQFLLYAASLIFKRELTQNKRWRETLKIVMPLLLLAYQIESPENNENWMKHCNEYSNQLIQMWNREGAFRCAQVGRTLLACIDDDKYGDGRENATLSINALFNAQSGLWKNSDELLSQLRVTCSDKQWRRQVFILLFQNTDQRNKEQTSLFIKNPKLNEPIFELPKYADIERYEESAQYLQPHSLQHMVYLCLGNDNLSDIRAKYFSGLNYSTQNLSFCGAESLNQLDIETFLYATSIQAKRILDIEREDDNYNKANNLQNIKPRILPFVNLRNLLCSEEQGNWWKSAYEVYKNLSTDNLAEVRANLQFGIEAIRGVNGPRMDIIIVLKLGQIFALRAQDTIKPVEKGFLEARAELLYKQALNMIKMNTKGVLEPFHRYFKYTKANQTSVERIISTIAEEAVSYLATRYFNALQYEELIDEFAGIQLPFATYLQAEAYRKMDESIKTPRKAKNLYLDRATDCLTQTLQLLKSTQTDPNHPLNSVIHSELKRLQAATSRFLNESNISYGYSPSNPLNNSSTYEDAEDDCRNDVVGHTSSTTITNRSRRDISVTSLEQPRNNELEQLVKQMASTLLFVKEEIVDTIKPEVLSMRKEITSLKDKISIMEESMKKMRLPSSNPPSRDDISNPMDDYYFIEDALQNQLFNNNSQQSVSQQQQQQQASNNLPPINNNLYPTFSNNQVANLSSPFNLQHQRIQPPNAIQMAQNSVYNSLFNANYPYCPQPQYMLGAAAQAAQAAATANAAANQLMGARNPLQLPFMGMDMNNLNFNLPTNAPLLGQSPQQQQPPQLSTTIPPTLQPNTADATVNLYNFLAQPNLQAPGQIPSRLPTIASTSMSMPISTLITPSSIATSTISAQSLLAAQANASSQQPQPITTLFNKTFNNQPVEKGPPANVVITSSDPLPNPNTAPLQTQQQTLSVTIPSHHIKPSVVQTEAITPPHVPIAPPPFTGFGLLPSTTSGSGITLLNSTTTTTTPSTTSITLGSNTNPSSLFTSFQPAGNTTTASFSSTFSFKQTPSPFNQTNKSNINLNDSTGSVDAEVEYDPIPDFKPIIPLPNEVPVKTGEEDEEVMFAQRAQLYRHDEKTWKERGIGIIKILKNKDGLSRIVMRREQTHKICANHKITHQLKITTPKNETKGYVWVANDFADEIMKLEKLFVRFKLPEDAKKFYDAYIKAQEEEKALTTEKTEVMQPPPQQQQPQSSTSSLLANPTATTFGLAKSSVITFTTSTPSTKTSEQIGTNAALISTTPTFTTNTSNNNTNISKSLFSGFNTPTANKNELPKQQNPSPFANFTFDNKAAVTISSTTTNSSTATTTTTASSVFSGNVFGNLSKPNTQSPFSNIGGNLQAFKFNPVPSPSTTTTPTPAPVVSTKQIDTSLNKSNASDNEDDYVPTQQFTPVIALPDLVEVTTGEEDEIILFEHRAKLLRFDKGTSEWKERGLGNIKILQNKNDVNKVRIVMRREQVHKLCCNQRLCKDTIFKYAKNSQTALNWAGQDYSENELITEMLTIRFKLPATCQEFFSAIVRAQEKMSDDTIKENATQNDKSDVKATSTALTANKTETKTVQKGFGDAFKQKPGSWSCTYCYIVNNADNLYCIACESPKDSTVPKKEAPSLLQPTTTNKFTFGFGAIAAQTTTTSTTTTTTNTISSQPPPISELFKPKVGAWECKSCYVSNKPESIHCVACDAPKDDTIPKKENTNSILDLTKTASKFNFGFNAMKPADTATSSNNIFSSGSGAAAAISATKTSSTAFSNFDEAANSSFTFTPPTATSTKVGSAITKPIFNFKMETKIENVGFGATATTTDNTLGRHGASGENFMPFILDKKDFNFTMKPKSPTKSPLKFGGGGDGEDDDGAYHEDEENNTYFTPVIPLPDKIDVKTGEEDEEILYAHRCKLFRFVDGEWKERGLGDIKILRHKQTKKLRVVMRRDQIFKICLNHALNDAVEYKAKDDKSWLFAVNDFSEGTVELEKLSLRFKNKEIAQDFMKAVKSALNGTAVPLDEATTTVIANKTDDVNKDNATNLDLTAEQKDIANKLLLPYEFFKPTLNCIGCRGCDSDNFVFNDNNLNEIFINMEDYKNPLLPLEQPNLTMPTKNNLSARTFLKQSALTTVATLSEAEISIDDKSKDANTSAGGGGGGGGGLFSGLGGNSFSSTFGDNAGTNTNFIFSLKNDDKKVDNNLTGDSGNATAFGSSSSSLLFGGLNNKDGNSIMTTAVYGSLNPSTKSMFDTTQNSSNGNAETNSNTTFTAVTSSSSSGDASKTKTLFDASKSVFGSSLATTQSSSIFGTSHLITEPKTNIFDSLNKNDTPSTQSLDLTKKQTTNEATATTIFGGDKAKITTPSTTADTSNFIFGGNNSNTLAFGKLGISLGGGNVNTTPSFGGGGGGNKNTTPTFGGGYINTTPTFGSSAISFGDLSNTNLATKLNGGNTNISFGSGSGLSFADLSNKGGDDFASLAAKSTNTTNKNNEKSSPGGFIGLTNQNAFSSFLKPNISLNSSQNAKDASLANESTQSANDNTNDDGADDNYDPHYEPIIELPKEIVVSTGEENEKKLFGERATLYRFDADKKEWKERGVGEFKVLFHPEMKSYRLLLRREQIHKLVLNHGIGADFVFNNMNNNQKSFVWATINYAESNDGEVEQLAVRFKKLDTAEEFKKLLNDCIANAKKYQAEK